MVLGHLMWVMKHTAKTIAQSIIDEINASPELSKCRTFSELHDFCDANTLGNSEAILDELHWDDAITLLNEAQEIVNKKLAIK